MRRLLAALCMAAGLLTAGGAAQGPGIALADGGNSANAHLCQQGGYLQLQSDSGQAFASQDQCVSYGAQGGTLFSPSLTLVFAGGVPSGGMCGPITNVFAPQIWCIAVTGSGFHANSPLTITVTDSPGGSSTFPFGTTDGSGSFPFEHFGSCPTFTSGVTETITATDAQGLHATISSLPISCI